MRLLLAMLISLCLPLASGVAATLDDVKARGQVSCGVTGQSPGYAELKGSTWVGFDIDFCRAIAAAVLGDADKVSIVEGAADEQIVALQAGEIDLIVSSNSWRHDRDGADGLLFATTRIFDSIALVALKSSNISLNGSDTTHQICAVSGEAAKSHVANYMEALKQPYRLIELETWNDALIALADSHCSLAATTVSQAVSSVRKNENLTLLAERPMVLPRGPLVRQGDDSWLLVVRWVAAGALEAERLGVTLENALAQGRAKLQGASGKEGENPLGLAADWLVTQIAKTGNYAEQYDRHFGAASANPIPRGPNALWREGGLHVPPVFQE